MIILGIESSCDDTSLALLKGSDAGFEILAQKTASQIEIHKKYGGVVPEIAGRKHAEHILPVVEDVMQGHPKPDAIAVTSGPGLITGLLVGVEVAKSLSYHWEVPLVSVNHIEGHIRSVELEQNQKIEAPAICLITSGGHTDLLLMKDDTMFEKIGGTRDDAAGEAFDKVAKLLGLEYPGGPKISKLAGEGNPNRIPFPRPMIDSDNLDFSFSGLKTAALYWLQDHTLAAIDTNSVQLPAGFSGVSQADPTIHDFCASFEQAIVDVLVAKTVKAIHTYRPKTLVLGGGVSANQRLRSGLQEATTHTSISHFLFPKLTYCMDNGTMIAAAGYYKALRGEYTNWRDIEANPNWRLYESH